MELELQQQQRMHAQEKDKRVTAEAAAAKLQLHVESLESNAQTLQQQVRALLASFNLRVSPPPPPPLSLQLLATQGNMRALQDAVRNGDQTASAYRQEGAMLQVTAV